MKCLLIEGGIIPGFHFHPVTQASGYHSFCAHPNIFVSSVHHACLTDGEKRVSMQSALFPHAHVCLWAAREEEEEEQQGTSSAARAAGRLTGETARENTTVGAPINGHPADGYRGRISLCFSHCTRSSRKHSAANLGSGRIPSAAAAASSGMISGKFFFFFRENDSREK